MKRTEWRQETKQMRFEDAYAGCTAVMPDPDPASRKTWLTHKRDAPETLGWRP